MGGDVGVFSQTTTGVLACLVLMGAVGTTGLISGGSASSGGNSGEDPDLSAAEVVALRFPSEAEEAASARVLTEARVSPIEQQILSILAFNPNPLGIPGPRAWAPEQGAAAEPVSAPAGSAASQSRPAQPARSVKRQPQTLFNDAQIANIKERLRLTREQ